MNENQDLAEGLMKKAIALEDETSFMYGPPDVVKPSSELYADWLLSQKRVEEAEKHYNKVLERAPKRLLAIQGIQKSRQSF